MDAIDKYLEELSKIYSTEKFRLLPINDVIDKLLDIRNSLERDKVVDTTECQDVA